MSAGFTTSLPTRYNRLVIFDCDGVLAYHKGSWATIHEKLGTVDHQQEHLERFKKGELNMSEWSEVTVEYWEGRPASAIHEAASEAILVDGFHETVCTLKERGFAVGVVSAGVLQYVVDIVGDAPVNFIISNAIETANGEITGEAQIDVIDVNKIDWFRKLADACEVPKSNIVLVGDATNDLAKLHENNLGIAFNPQSDEVREVADVVIEDGDLRLILEPIEDWLADNQQLQS